MADKELVIGQIGYGYWGPNLARNLSELEGVRLKYICDSSADRLSQAAIKHPQTGLVGDTGTVMADNAIDAVVIASPAVSHFSLCREALASGKHVLVEKPLCLDVRQGRELVGLAEERGLVLMVGHVFLYHPAVTFMREYIDSGQAGNVLYAYSQRLNLGRLRHDENCLWSLAPHDISIMLHLMQAEPESVSARGACYLRENLEDIIFCTIYFDGGQLGNIHVSWLDPHKVRTFTVVGTEKMLVFDDMVPDGKVKVFDKRVYREDGVPGYGEEFYLHVGDEVLPAIRMEEPLQAECRHFRDCVMTGARPVSDGRQGLRVLEVLDAATRSISQGGRPVEIGRGSC